jgi:hypothetical protein
MASTSLLVDFTSCMKRIGWHASGKKSVSGFAKEHKATATQQQQQHLKAQLQNHTSSPAATAAALVPQRMRRLKCLMVLNDIECVQYWPNCPTMLSYRSAELGIFMKYSGTLMKVRSIHFRSCNKGVNKRHDVLPISLSISYEILAVEWPNQQVPWGWRGGGRGPRPDLNMTS